MSTFCIMVSMLESLWKQYSQNEHSVNDDMKKKKKKASVELSSLSLATHYFKYQSRFGFNKTSNDHIQYFSVFQWSRKDYVVVVVQYEWNSWFVEIFKFKCWLKAHDIDFTGELGSKVNTQTLLRRSIFFIYFWWASFHFKLMQNGTKSEIDRMIEP